MTTLEQRSQIIEAAQAAYKNAYARYSDYNVGAALLAADGRIFKGVNVENAVFGLTICAERAAVFNAVTEGVHDFKAIAIVTRDAGTSCGSCRQVLAEFGVDIEVFLVDVDGNIRHTTTIGELLPFSFGAENIKKTG